LPAAIFHNEGGAEVVDRPGAAGSGEPPLSCGFLDQALQREAHRVVKIGSDEVGAAEMQLGDEPYEKYAALLYW
jgi:hypothetical protein